MEYVEGETLRAIVERGAMALPHLLNLGSQVVQSLGIVRNPLKTSLLSAADVKANPYAIRMMGPVARFINRLGGNFRWQHLPVPFEVYADGIDLVIFEEFGAGAAASSRSSRCACTAATRRR